VSKGSTSPLGGSNGGRNEPPQEEQDKTPSKLAPFEFADGTRTGLLVRRAVAEFVADPDGYRRDPDVTLTMIRPMLQLSATE